MADLAALLVERFGPHDRLELERGGLSPEVQRRALLLAAIAPEPDAAQHRQALRAALLEEVVRG